MRVKIRQEESLRMRLIPFSGKSLTHALKSGSVFVKQRKLSDLDRRTLQSGECAQLTAWRACAPNAVHAEF